MNRLGVWVSFLNPTYDTGKIVNITSQNDWFSWDKWKVNINDLEQLTGLNFFSNVDKTIQEIIEGSDTPATLSAPLMAARDSDEGSQSSLDYFFGESRIFVDNTSRVNTLPTAFTQIGIGEVNAAQVTVIKLGPLHSDISKNSSLKSSVLDDHIIQVTPVQNDSFAVGLTNSGTLEIGSSHIRFLQEGLAEVGIDKNGSTQIRDTKDSAIEMSIGQVSATQVNSSEINSLKITINDTDSTQVGILELASSQASSIQNKIVQINPSEISFSSNIALRQLLSSHNFNLQNTDVPTWLEFLQGTSPFNLNIEIIDLPTGQLAEASITGFDPTGRPNSGTLYSTPTPTASAGTSTPPPGTTANIAKP